MNAFDRNLDGPAILHYGDGDYAVISPGRYVICAMTGKAVPLEALKYWSVARQEAYAGPNEVLARLTASPKG